MEEPRDVAISGLLLLSALFNNSRSPRKHSGKRADQRTCSGREVLGGNGVGWRPARDHAYFLTLIAPLADCHSDFLRSSKCGDRSECWIARLWRRHDTVTRIVLKASCPKRTLWDRDSGGKGY
jgi:hypothetical protein